MKIIYFMLLLVLPNILINAQWVQITGLSKITINTLASNDEYIFAGTYDKGVYRSSNNGQDWSQINVGLSASNISILAVNGSNIFAGTRGYGLFRSTNSGSTWSELTNGLEYSGGQVYYFYSIAINGDTIFAGTDYEVFRSIDNGENWSQVNNGFQTDDDEVGEILSIVLKGNKVFTATSKGGVYFSNDYGLNWSAVNNGLPYYSLDYGVYNINTQSLIASGNDIFVAVDIAFEDFEFYRSSDDGANWTEVNNGLEYIHKATFTSFGDNIFLGTYDGEVYLTMNSGSNWFLINDGLSDEADIYSLLINNSYIFAGTYELGIWRRPLSEIITDISNIQNEIPTEYRLLQNYPNPFNPTTRIRFSIPTEGFVTLKIYDVLGKDVYTIVNENKLTGSYEIEFDGSELSTGIYFYKIQSGSFTDTKKFILLK